jgi:hypothetical protein
METPLDVHGDQFLHTALEGLHNIGLPIMLEAPVATALTIYFVPQRVVVLQVLVEFKQVSPDPHSFSLKFVLVKLE